jgi:hypothetical protein
MTCGQGDWLHADSQDLYVICDTGLTMAGTRRIRDAPSARRAALAGLAAVVLAAGGVLFVRPLGAAPCSARATHCERAPWTSCPRGPSGRHRRQGSTVAGPRGRRSPRVGGREVRGDAPGGSGLRSRGRAEMGTCSCRVVRDGTTGLCDRATGCGRRRASPEPTAWGDRAAVPCRPVTRAGARSHDVPAVRHTHQRSHAWFFRGRPWLARTTGPTKTGRARHAPYG